MAEFILETENRLELETRPQTKNSSKPKEKLDSKFVLDGKTSKLTLESETQDDSFALAPK